jgi:lipoate-protein ligase A
MIYIEAESMDCAFHFAAEEYVMSVLKPASPVLMLWRTDKTVMIGANQIAEIEADLPYAQERGIAVVRRSSGGGTIYTDPDTLLYTIILPYDENTDTKDVIRGYLAAPVISALASMGVEGSLEGRNDILVDGRKISGIAQYIRYGYLCSHGSLLFAADLSELVRVLTVDDSKIISKALRSVRSRVTNIAEHLPAGAGADSGADSGAGAVSGGATDVLTFMKRLRQSWHDAFRLEEYKFSEDDIEGINRLRNEKYASDNWTFGRTPHYSFRNSKRFPGGGVEIFAEVKSGVTENVRITGDFLALLPVDDIEARLRGIPFRRDALSAALTDGMVRRTLGSISKDELLSVFEEQ